RKRDFAHNYRHINEVVSRNRGDDRPAPTSVGIRRRRRSDITILAHYLGATLCRSSPRLLSYRWIVSRARSLAPLDHRASVRLHLLLFAARARSDWARSIAATRYLSHQHVLHCWTVRDRFSRSAPAALALIESLLAVHPGTREAD